MRSVFSVSMVVELTSDFSTAPSCFPLAGSSNSTPGAIRERLKIGRKNTRGRKERREGAETNYVRMYIAPTHDEYAAQYRPTTDNNKKPDSRKKNETRGRKQEAA